MPDEPTFSVIVPAFNEEDYLAPCLEAIDRAARRLGEPVEVIVVDNESTDLTPVLAREYGARVVTEPAKNLSAIRNAGARAATGRYLCFIDADSYMSRRMLTEVKKVLDSGRYIGGGVANVRSDRMSLGILCSALVFLPFFLIYMRIACVMFYTKREHFEAVGGFNEKLFAVEDVDFGRRLKAYGRSLGLRYKNLWRARVTTSARKFDEYGDWFLVTNPGFIRKALKNDRDAAHEFWYRERR